VEGDSLQSSLPYSFITTSHTTPFFLSFSSLIPILHRPAASTAREFCTTFHRCASAPAVRISINTTTVRTYAKAKKMGPKKPVKEEKILLGRPGNSLKSGIVSAMLSHD
jgi:obg-like ATPase 1